LELGEEVAEMRVKLDNTAWRILGGLSSLVFGSLIITGIIILMNASGA
jgi:quinol-cytochrome oxidoreductase complex cytochrome b subunit